MPEEFASREARNGKEDVTGGERKASLLYQPVRLRYASLWYHASYFFPFPPPFAAASRARAWRRISSFALDSRSGHSNFGAFAGS